MASACVRVQGLLEGPHEVRGGPDVAFAGGGDGFGLDQRDGTGGGVVDAVGDHGGVPGGDRAGGQGGGGVGQHPGAQRAGGAHGAGGLAGGLVGERPQPRAGRQGAVEGVGAVGVDPPDQCQGECVGLGGQDAQLVQQGGGLVVAQVLDAVVQGAGQRGVGGRDVHLDSRS